MMKKEIDLGLKIGSKERIVWTEIQINCKASIEGCEKELIVQRAFLVLAEQKIALENAKFK